MPAKLLAISGPLRKSEFSMGSDLLLGRGADSAIRLEDPAVSPHHCRIEIRDGRPTLIDLDSDSGTFVNGIPVKQRELNPGEEIAVGNSVFLFEVDAEKSPPAMSSVRLSELPTPNVQALEFHAEELLSLEPESLGALPQPLRRARNLSALLQICRVIGSLRDEESLPWQLLGVIFDVIPAQRGAILLLEEDSHEIRSQVAWDREHGPAHSVELNRDVVRRVIDEKVSLMDSGAESQGGAHRALLCVPMGSKEKTIGLIYLESSSPATALTEDDFQLLTAIAALGVVGIENARQFESLGSENQRLRAEVSLTHDMVGRSPRMREVYQFIERVASSDSTILICGESGTGKELAARAIHKNSPRKNQPFVALNCAALTETLLESELFGHEKGAFTSAISLKRGFLEVADGGTIFLDEIAELSPILQAKLLRVLQEREFMRVGGTRPIKFNVRFLAATNKDLPKAVREEKFRADLFHRLNVISITLPSLREHPEDQSSGNITEAAKLLGVHANYLHRLMKNFAVRPLLKKQTGA